ncbi:alpha/beta-hydrolase family protein [Pseudonocardia benzenivorans]
MDSADTAEDRAALAVADLERAGGFDRARLLVATTTGQGWLDAGTMSSFEYVAGGDSAIVALQYSFVPSGFSYLVDASRAQAAGRALFDAVYGKWASLPVDHRPQLYVFGESLGSFGGEAAFSGESDLRNRTSGALFVGPPNFNALHTEFRDGRDPGSREVEPVYRNGRTVRFSTDIDAGAPPVGAPWDGSRTLILQHPSDPITWWSPRLLFSRPDWLAEPRGRDVLPAMTWLPVVTFWQVTLDMPAAADVPEGHGHRYTRESVDAWATLLRPPDWTPQKADQLRAIISP